MEQTIIDTNPATETISSNSYGKKKAIFRTYQVVWYILGVVETLLIFRFILRLLAANPSSPFASFIYGLSYPFVYPFVGLFATPAMGGSVIEIYSVLAMIVYWVIAFGIVKIMQLVNPATPSDVVNKVDDPSVKL